MAPKERLSWSEQDTKKFLEICIQLKAGSSGRKTNWAKIVQGLNVATGKNFNDKQARNKYDDLKAQFKIWNEMELKWTGLLFDPESGCPQVDQDDRWAGFVEKHKGIPARFLKKPLANLALLRSLYSGSFATSKYSYSPGCESGKSLLGEGDGNDTEETGDSDDCFETELGEEKCDSGHEESKSPPTTKSKGKRKNVGSTSSSKKAKTDIETCLEILKMFILSGSPSLEVSKHSQVATALNDLKEVKEKSEDFIFKCMQFLRAGDNGDYFLALSSNQQKLMFLKTAFDINLPEVECVSTSP
ncbi:unnamed protein product [Amaranthus hypochondriacus]